MRLTPILKKEKQATDSPYGEALIQRAQGDLLCPKIRVEEHITLGFELAKNMGQHVRNHKPCSTAASGASNPLSPTSTPLYCYWRPFVSFLGTSFLGPWRKSFVRGDLWTCERTLTGPHTTSEQKCYFLEGPIQPQEFNWVMKAVCSTE